MDLEYKKIPERQKKLFFRYFPISQIPDTFITISSQISDIVRNIKEGEMVMYDENKEREQEIQNRNREDLPMETTPNFIMRDPEPQDNHSMQENRENRWSENPQPQSDSWNAQHSQQPYRQYQAGQQSQMNQQYTSSCPYGNSQNMTFSGESAEADGKKKKRKPSKTARKVAGITAAALLFGTISGGTMVGINLVADSLKKPQYQQVGQAETIPDSSVSAGTEGTGSENSVSYATSMDVSAIVEKAMPSVVAITNTALYQSSNWFGQTHTYEVPSSGSGIIIGQNEEELLVVTNNHVVEGANTLAVTFIDDTAVNAAVKGTDSETDLAVIAVPLADIPEGTMGQISVAAIGDSDELKVGQGVVAIGNALGYGQSVTVGYISALDREVQTENNVSRNLLQTDAAINPGNSGGALLNMKGEVIGINAAKYSSTDVEGMGYAIPISKAQDIINNLMMKRTRKEVDAEKAGYLGIQGQNIDVQTAQMLDMPTGIFVYKIIEGGAASRTDLREKDIITKFDDQSVQTMASLQDMLKYYEAGETVNLTVQSLEDGAYVERTVEITLGSRETLQEK